jgi:NRPS condensation-like uncharacterized protein
VKEMDNPYIWENLLIGIRTMLASGIPYDAVNELRIVFIKAYEDKRISQHMLEQFDQLIER